MEYSTLKNHYEGRIMQSIKNSIANSTKQNHQQKTQFITEQRKADTRRKIMLGGLIIKAKLDYLYPEQAQIIYGLLLDCRNALQDKPELAKKWQLLGEDLSIPIKKK